jgi:surface carbohydrate biosynthesis protein
VRIDFSLPRRTKLVYFGRTGLGILRNYILEEDHVIYESPTARINFWVALRMLFTGKLSEPSYYRAFLLSYRPEVVITMEDNNLTFYATKLILPECKSLAIQNGIRHSMSHSAETNFKTELQRRHDHGYRPDIIATNGGMGTVFFEEALARDVRVKFVEVGSLLNNSLSVSETGASATKGRIVFISKFPNLGKHQQDSRWGNEITQYIGKASFTAASYHSVEGELAQLCADFALNNGLSLAVLGKRPAWQVAERQFFQRYLENYSWEYLPSGTQASSYQAIRPQDIIVNVDSTLGYELFARGLRVVFVCARMTHSGSPHIVEMEFGFPLIIEPCGPFWTNTATHDEVFRVLKYAQSTTGNEWTRVTQSIRERLFLFDEGNSKFCELLDALHVLNTGPGLWRQELVPEN